MDKQNSIKTFQKIWQEESGEKIPVDYALIQSNKLITFFKTIVNYLEIKERKQNENK
jgi:hypothetical protein